MRRAAILSMYVFLFLMIVSQPVVADAQVEIVISDTEVFENEEFSFSAKFTNSDALAYDTFHLYSTGTEELNWGYHTFHGEDWYIYTEEYTISLSELGYYTIYVTVFAMFDSGIPEITDSISVHVVEKAQVSTLGALELLFYISVIILVGIVCIGLLTTKRRKKSEEVTEVALVPAVTEPAPPKEAEVLEQEPIRERIITERVLVICPYCGAKNEQGVLKCRACGAEM